MYLADTNIELESLFTCAQIENGILIAPMRHTHMLAAPAYPHLFPKPKKKAHRISVCCLFSNLSVEPFQLKYPTMSA